jgi:hypothetical protein
MQSEADQDVAVDEWHSKDKNEWDKIPGKGIIVFNRSAKFVSLSLAIFVSLLFQWTTPAQASEPIRGCNSFTQALILSVNSANKRYMPLYRIQISRGSTKNTAAELASGGSNAAFWVEIRRQSTRAIDSILQSGDYLDVNLLSELTLMSLSRDMKEMDGHYRRAAKLCALNVTGEWPNVRVSRR